MENIYDYRAEVYNQEEIEARAKKLQDYKDKHNGKTPAQVMRENNTQGRVPSSYDNDMANRNNPFN